MGKPCLGRKFHLLAKDDGALTKILPRETDASVGVETWLSTSLRKALSRHYISTMSFIFIITTIILLLRLLQFYIKLLVKDYALDTQQRIQIK